jgi:hypothetical protein
MHTDTDTDTDTHTHTHTTHTHDTHTHARTHTRTRARTHTQQHAHTHARARTHTHSLFASITRTSGSIQGLSHCTHSPAAARPRHCHLLRASRARGPLGGRWQGRLQPPALGAIVGQRPSCRHGTHRHVCNTQYVNTPTVCAFFVLDENGCLCCVHLYKQARFTCVLCFVGVLT